MRTIICETLNSKKAGAGENANERSRMFIGFTYSEFCLHQYEAYENFIALDLRHAPELINYVRYSELFRKFWNAEWHRRNLIEFLPFAEDNNMSLTDLRGEYLFMHSVERLLNQPAFLNGYEDLLRFIIPADKIKQLR